MRTILCAVALFLAFSVEANPNKRQLMKFTTMKPVSIKAGTEKIVKIPFEVEKGFHVQSNPAAQKRLIATALKLKSNNGFVPGKVKYPKGKPYKMKTFPSKITVYAGKFFLSVPIKVAKATAAGSGKVEGSVRYQACNDVTCFFPKSIPVTVPIKVTN